MPPVMPAGEAAVGKLVHHRGRIGGASGTVMAGFGSPRKVNRTLSPTDRAPRSVRVHVLDVHDHDLAALDLAEEDLLRQLVLDLALDGPAQRPGALHGVEPAPCEQRLRR